MMQEERREQAHGSSSTGQMERGMAAFVRQTIGMYRSGFDSRRMLLQVGLLCTLCSSVSPLPCSHFVHFLAALTICSHTLLCQACQHA